MDIMNESEDFIMESDEEHPKIWNTLMDLCATATTAQNLDDSGFSASFGISRTPLFAEHAALHDSNLNFCVVKETVTLLDLPDGVLLRIVQYIPKRDLKNVALIINTNASMIRHHARHTLAYLDMSRAHVSAEVLSQILLVCQLSLKKLSLECVDLSDQCLCKIIGGCHDLDTLNLCMCTGLTPFSLLFTLYDLKRLKSLNIAWIDLTPRVITLLLERLTPSLRELDISGCKKALTDEHTEILTSRCKKLECLDISDAHLLTSKSIESIVRNLKKLKHLRASRCVNCFLEPSITISQLSQLPKLKNLDLFGIINTHKEPLWSQSILRGVRVNEELYSSIARPVTKLKKSRFIWDQSLQN